MDFVLVLDESGSMTNSMDGDDGLKAFAKGLVGEYALGEDKARFAVVSFAEGATLRTTFSHNQTHIDEAIDAITAGGNTAISDGLQMARDQFSCCYNRGASKLVLLLSDGEQTVCSDGSFEHNGGACPDGQTPTQTAIAKAGLTKDDGVTIFAWGFGGANEATLQQIASDPEKAIFETKLSELRGHLRELRQDACAVSLPPPSPPPPGPPPSPPPPTPPPPAPPHWAWDYYEECVNGTWNEEALRNASELALAEDAATSDGGTRVEEERVREAWDAATIVDGNASNATNATNCSLLLLLLGVPPDLLAAQEIPGGGGDDGWWALLLLPFLLLLLLFLLRRRCVRRPKRAHSESVEMEEKEDMAPPALDMRPPPVAGEPGEEFAPMANFVKAPRAPQLKERPPPVTDVPEAEAEMLGTEKEVTSKFRWAVDVGHYYWKGSGGASRPVAVGWGKMGATASTPRTVGEMVTMEPSDNGSAEKLVKSVKKRGMTPRAGPGGAAAGGAGPNASVRASWDNAPMV